jgi:hypothetical protein
MMDTTAPQEKSNGLATYLQVLYAPTEAFAQLARTPTWGWAMLIGIALLIVASIISLPEVTKISEIAQQQALSQMSADQQAQAKQGMAAAAGFTRGAIIAGPLFVAWIIWFFVALIYVIAAAVTGANPSLRMAWVAAVNASAVSFVVQVVNALILALRGPDAISGPLDAYAIPSLGMLVHGSVKTAAFLNAYSIGTIWQYVVTVIALEQVMKMNRGAAIVTVIVLSVLSGAAGAAFAR